MTQINHLQRYLGMFEPGASFRVQENITPLFPHLSCQQLVSPLNRLAIVRFALAEHFQTRARETWEEFLWQWVFFQKVTHHDSHDPDDGDWSNPPAPFTREAVRDSFRGIQQPTLKQQIEYLMVEPEEAAARLSSLAPTFEALEDWTFHPVMTEANDWVFLRMLSLADTPVLWLRLAEALDRATLYRNKDTFYGPLANMALYQCSEDLAWRLMAFDIPDYLGILAERVQVTPEALEPVTDAARAILWPKLMPPWSLGFWATYKAYLKTTTKEVKTALAARILARFHARCRKIAELWMLTPLFVVLALVILDGMKSPPEVLAKKPIPPSPYREAFRGFVKPQSGHLPSEYLWWISRDLSDGGKPTTATGFWWFQFFGEEEPSYQPLWDQWPDRPYISEPVLGFLGSLYEAERLADADEIQAWQWSYLPELEPLAQAGLLRSDDWGIGDALLEYLLDQDLIHHLPIDDTCWTGLSDRGRKLVAWWNSDGNNRSFFNERGMVGHDVYALEPLEGFLKDYEQAYLYDRLAFEYWRTGTKHTVPEQAWLWLFHREDSGPDFFELMAEKGFGYHRKGKHFVWSAVNGPKQAMPYVSGFSWHAEDALVGTLGDLVDKLGITVQLPQSLQDIPFDGVRYKIPLHHQLQYMVGPDWDVKKGTNGWVVKRAAPTN